MLRVTVLSALLVAGACVGPAFARKATFPKATVGCPTEAGMIGAYEIAGQQPHDLNAMQAAFDHYDCAWIPAGSSLTVVRQGTAISIVVMPRVFSKDLWLYVPTFSFDER